MEKRPPRTPESGIREKAEALSKKIFITDSGLISTYGVQEQKTAVSLFGGSAGIQDKDAAAAEETTGRIAQFLKTKDREKRKLQANSLCGDRMTIEDALQITDLYLEKLGRSERNLQIYISAGEIKLSQVKELMGKGTVALPGKLQSPEGLLYLTRCTETFTERITSLKTTLATCLQYRASLELRRDSLRSQLDAVNGILKELIPLEQIDR